MKQEMEQHHKVCRTLKRITKMLGGLHGGIGTTDDFGGFRVPMHSILCRDRDKARRLIADDYSEICTS